MGFQNALSDDAFRTMLSRASALMDAHYKDHVAAEELRACVGRLQSEAESLHVQLQKVIEAADAHAAEGIYWRSRAGLMIRALRKWQGYERALQTGGPAGASQARAFAIAHDATAEAMAAVSPAGLQ